ncbi:regulation of nuclear pre-mRNA domain-containing protein 2 [Ischnura elegans]|uniref:regulation of nuclear pre-mRNA domain-containing protein 2 n=1 Tax=Ischnura elegans TaxID=197161 RepID=UPI001ED8B9FF|nr:regulation of nuclear pre-mRNA domain-containing protein 2 [Ischnura elegans]
MVFISVTDKMSAFNEHQFEKRLLTLKDSQESIQTLSSWCLQHRQHHKKIVSAWLKVLRKVRPDQRLTLFYLANDVIQYSKRKAYDYVQTFAPALQKATTLVRDNKVKQNISRIFKIWDERGVYDETFISDLNGLLTASTKGQVTETVTANDFQPRILIEKIKSCKECEDETDLLLKKLNDSHLSLSDADALRASLKDRRQGDDLVTEVDEGVAKMEAYVRALDLELKERAVLIELLDQGSVFYDTQKGEAKVVANAYKNFGGRVKNLKRRLDELIPNLKDCSPVPSPDINAPSPSPDSDIELPEEADPIQGLLNQTSSSSFDAVVADQLPVKTHARGELPHSLDSRLSSFMGNNLSFDFKKSIFNETSTDTPRSPSPTPLLESGDHDLSAGEPILSSASDEGKPIEVIGSRSKGQENFNISDFLKSLSQGFVEPFLQTDSSSSAIPGLNLSNPGSASALSPSVKSLVGTSAPLFSSPPGVFEQTSGQFNYQKPVPAPSTESLNTSIEPLPPPPPLPPGLFMSEDGDWSDREGGSQMPSPGEWNTKLPPKFPTWGDPSPSAAWEAAGAAAGNKTPTKVDWFSSSLLGKSPSKGIGSKANDSIEETPESPPTYEKEGFSDPVEYDDTDVPEIGSVADVDHRTLTPMAPNNRLRELKDIDHRNLISLTGSPAANFRAPLNVSGPQWTPSEIKASDQDYRSVSSVGMKSSLINLTPQKGKDEEGDRDYRLPVPAPLLSKMQELAKRDELHDLIESVDMEMSDDEDNADAMGKEPMGKSEEKEAGLGQEKRTSANKPNLKPLSKPAEEEEEHNEHERFSNEKKDGSEPYDPTFPTSHIQKIPTISSDRIFRPRTPMSQNFPSPIIRQTFDSHFPAMPPVLPTPHMFRMPPHDLGKPPPPIMTLPQPLLLQQKPPPPPPPPPPLPPLLTPPMQQKPGVNDRDNTPIQPVGPPMVRNITPSLSQSPSVPSRFQSDVNSPLPPQNNSIKEPLISMTWEKTEVTEKEDSWVASFGEQANGSFKNSQNEDLNSSVNEKESYGQGSTSDAAIKEFRVGSTLRIRSLTEINTKDPPPFTNSNIKDDNIQEKGPENTSVVTVIPNASLNLSDNDTVGKNIISEDKTNTVSNVSTKNVEGIDNEGGKGVMEELSVEHAETDQESMNSSFDSSNVSEFPRDEMHDPFFSPGLAFPPPGMGFSVPPPQRGGRGGRGGFRGAGGPIRFGIPPQIMPRFFRPPPLFSPMRQPISPDVQFVGGRGPRTLFRPFRGAQGPFGGRW